MLAAMVLAELLVPAALSADYLGTKTVRIFLEPATSAAFNDGIQNGDEVCYIMESTPYDTGSEEGQGSWMTAYLPAGSQVIGADFVQPAGNGSYTVFPGEPTDATYDGWGTRGSVGYVPSTGTQRLAEGYVNEVQQDTGIFYSTDPRTALVVAGLPTQLDPTGGPPPQTFFNQWDFDQTLAFGVKNGDGNISGNDGRGNTPLISTDGGATWKGTGSPVAGPLTYYTNDYNPACNGPGSTAFVQDVQCVGPWQRIAKAGSRIGGSTSHTPIAPATAGGAISNTSVIFGSGYSLSTTNPLPANTNTIRWAHGQRRLGEIETARLCLRITNAAAFEPALSNNTFCLDSLPSDTADTAAKDNTWRYYEPKHNCLVASGKGNLFKQAKYVNGAPFNGAGIASNDIIGYEITFTNTSTSTLTNVMLSDVRVTSSKLEALVEPGSANCPFSSYNGTLPGPTYTAGSATSGTATWATIPSLPAGSSVKVFMCGRAKGGLGDFAENLGRVTFTLPNSQTVSLTSLASSPFGSRITGTVYVDKDSSGTLTAGDVAGVGVIVTLYQDVNNNGVVDAGDIELTRAITANDGSYSFLGYPGGNYLVVETDPTGWTSTADKDTARASCPATACNVIRVVLSNEGSSTLNDFFDFTAGATYALISRFRAFESRGHVLVEWKTAAEAGTLGFDLERFNPRTGRWRRLNSGILPALLGSPQGGRYQFVDEKADPGPTRQKILRYRIREIDASGENRTYGPFAVRVERESTLGEEATLELVDGFGSRPHSLPILQLESLAVAANEEQDAAKQMALPGGDKPAAVAVKLRVPERGLYYVDPERLAGLLGASAETLREALQAGRLSLRNLGRDIPWWSPGNGAGLYFVGEPIDSIYTRDNVYRLSLDRGAQMKQSSGGRPSPVAPQPFIDSVEVEQQRFAATAFSEDAESDYWYWDFVFAGNSIYGTRTFALPLSSVAAGSAMLRVDLAGATDTMVFKDHHVAVAVNGFALGEASWAGLSRHRAELPVPGGVLQSGTNTVELRGLLDPEVALSVFYVDGFEVEYLREPRAVADRLVLPGNGGVVSVAGFTNDRIAVFDISDPHRTTVLTNLTVDPGDGFRVSFSSKRGARYLVTALSAAIEPEASLDRSSDLGKVEGVDYLIIAPAALAAGAERLAALRRSSGLGVKVVDLEDIYDEVNDSLPSPHAVKSFLREVHKHWKPRPRYVVLVGDGTFDYKNYQGLGGNLMPPLMVATGSGLFPSDNRLADVSGDRVPDFAIGRLPVLTAAELDGYLDKLEAYERAAPDDWQTTVLLVADNADAAGDFPRASNGLAALIPAGYTARNLQLTTNPGEHGNVRANLFAHLDRGALLWNYLGHGGLDRLTDEGLFSRSDIPALANGDRLPALASMTCAIGRFELPGLVSLAEDLVNSKDRGVIAAWAPAGLSFHSEAILLNEALFAALFPRDGGERPRFGEAVRRALQSYAAGTPQRFMLDIFNVFGDPALRLK